MIGGGSQELAQKKADDPTNEDSKPTISHKNNKGKKISPILICSILTAWMIVGVLLGISLHSVLLISGFLLPVVAYEIYRTKGESTTFASWALLVVIVLEMIFLIFGISYDLGKYLNLEYTYVGGQYVPLGDIKILGPTLLAIFSLILLFRTAGPYTKWLSVIIIVAALVMVNIMNPEIFKVLLRSGVERLSWYF